MWAMYWISDLYGAKLYNTAGEQVASIDCQRGSCDWIIEIANAESYTASRTFDLDSVMKHVKNVVLHAIPTRKAEWYLEGKFHTLYSQDGWAQIELDEWGKPHTSDSHWNVDVNSEPTIHLSSKLPLETVKEIATMILEELGNGKGA